MVRPADNPFRTRCLDALTFRMPEGEWDALCRRVAASGYRGAIVGPHGAGKSTLLRRLMGFLQARGIPVVPCFLNRETRREAADRIAVALRACGPGFVLCLDGAEQLGPLRWQRTCWRTRGLRGLIVTAHREGRLPTLHRCGTTPDLVDALLEELLPGHDAPTRAAAQEAWRRHQGNMRSVLFDLYDRHAAL